MNQTERDLYREDKCQYCGTMGHIAKIYWWIPKQKTTHDSEIPQALAALTLDNTVVDTEWTSDTGASNHMTSKPGHFCSTGIVHQVSCPYTPEQTGMVERRHIIIRELGMTMLFHSGTPLFLLVEAFTTAVYLINRLPSSTLNSNTPYFLLHGRHPIYSSLCIFGSQCFPYT